MKGKLVYVVTLELNKHGFRSVFAGHYCGKLNEAWNKIETSPLKNWVFSANTDITKNTFLVAFYLGYLSQDPAILYRNSIYINNSSLPFEVYRSKQSNGMTDKNVFYLS